MVHRNKSNETHNEQHIHLRNKKSTGNNNEVLLGTLLLKGAEEIYICGL